MQDVDRTQLRLALLLAAPSNRIFAVGDDDQTYDKSLPVSRS
jgi:superfamily I DNA/RNA helicase